MCEFKVAQIPSSRAVKRNFYHSKLKPYTVKRYIRHRNLPCLLSQMCRLFGAETCCCVSISIKRIYLVSNIVFDECQRSGKRRYVDDENVNNVYHSNVLYLITFELIYHLATLNRSK